MKEFDKYLGKVGFEIIESNQRTQIRKNGDVVYWITYFVKKINQG